MKNLKLIITIAVAVVIVVAAYVFYKPSNLASSVDVKGVAKIIGDANIINTEKAFELFKTANVVFVDNRSPEFFGEKHIVGALNMPFGDEDEKNNSLTQAMVEAVLKNHSSVVFYCDDGARSSKALKQIADWEIGLGNVFWLKDGISKWIDNEYPTEKPPMGDEVCPKGATRTKEGICIFSTPEGVVPEQGASMIQGQEDVSKTSDKQEVAAVRGTCPAAGLGKKGGCGGKKNGCSYTEPEDLAIIKDLKEQYPILKTGKSDF
ncbi:MAG: rhodanese-like domain-containing protein [Alphaproteobacteria bacterium]